MRLLLRIKDPCDPRMVVEAQLDYDFLVRAHKLVLICGKIRRTMCGAARITIDNSREYVMLESETVIGWVMGQGGCERLAGGSIPSNSRRLDARRRWSMLSSGRNAAKPDVN